MENTHRDRDLDDIDSNHDLEDAPVNTWHSLFNKTKRVKFVFNVQSLFDGLDIAIHLISGSKLSRLRSIIQIQCLQVRKFLNPDCDYDPDNFPLVYGVLFAYISSFFLLKFVLPFVTLPYEVNKSRSCDNEN